MTGPPPPAVKRASDASMIPSSKLLMTHPSGEIPQDSARRPDAGRPYPCPAVNRGQAPCAGFGRGWGVSVPVGSHKVWLDGVLDLLETTCSKQIRGLLPRMYAESRIDPEDLRGLINLFSKDVFEQ